jgi:hypothetical protein
MSIYKNELLSIRMIRFGNSVPGKAEIAPGEKVWKMNMTNCLPDRFCGKFEKAGYGSYRGAL